MDNKVRASAIFFLCMFLYLPITIGDEMQDNVEGYSKKEPSFWLWETLRNAYSNFYTPVLASSGNWQKVKALMKQAYTYFFPPNLDFRRGNEAEPIADGGAAEKVKAALAKSLGKSKATVEDAAKSAAKIAEEALQKTKEKVKKSLSERERLHQNEL